MTPIETTQERVDEIKALHAEIAGHFRQSLEKAIRIGELLSEQKAALRHGEFTAWITRNLPFTDRTARSYMRVYENRDRLKTESVSDLTTAYRLLAAPQPKQGGGVLEVIDEALEAAKTRLEQLRDELEEADTLDDLKNIIEEARLIGNDVAEINLRLQRLGGQFLDEVAQEAKK